MCLECARSAKFVPKPPPPLRAVHNAPHILHHTGSRGTPPLTAKGCADEACACAICGSGCQGCPWLQENKKNSVIYVSPNKCAHRHGKGTNGTSHRTATHHPTMHPFKGCHWERDDACTFAHSPCSLNKRHQLPAHPRCTLARPDGSLHLVSNNVLQRLDGSRSQTFTGHPPPPFRRAQWTGPRQALRTSTACFLLCFWH